MIDGNCGRILGRKGWSSFNSHRKEMGWLIYWLSYEKLSDGNCLDGARGGANASTSSEGSFLMEIE